MNKNIYGDKAAIDRARNAKPGDTSVMVNWDAINDLPDQYEVIISEVKFDLSTAFSDVGNNTYMPTPAMHYKIAEAKGIKGGEKSILEPIYEDVDTSEMNLEDTPNFQKMLVGYRCSKYSTVLEEDGTERRSSVCTIDYNVWNRCTEMWSNEEAYSDGYTKQSKYPPKYETKWKRKKHFKSELKFAMQKAETKAHEKTIRELAGLMTGYKAEDLREGRLIFAKVRRSRAILQAETAARLQAMANGHKVESEPAKLLFDAVIEEEPVQTEQPAHQRFLDAIDSYNIAGLIPQDKSATIEAMVNWIETQGESAPDNELYWNKAVGILKEIESTIPVDAKVQHGLY